MNFLRLFKIIFVISKYRLDVFIPLRLLPWWVRFLLFFNPMKLFPQTKKPKELRLRMALEALGPLFIKFGQILSTRRDLFSEALSDELKHLQDEVKPFAGEIAKQIVETQLQTKLENVFAEFDLTALASASVAQVHSAQLLNGDQVVVKIIRPNIEKIIRQDIKVLYFFAKLLVKFFKEARRLRPVEVVEDYETTLLSELDLQREAANTCQLRRNFKYSDSLYIPEIYWEYTRERVLVEERIYGIPIGNKDELLAANVNMKRLAEKGVEIFFTQVFTHNFFHADMHPGNIFVDARNPENPRYIAIDCGIVGSLDAEDKSYLAQNILAFFHQDYDSIAQLHIDSGWVGKTTKKQEFVNVIRGVSEPMFERPFDEISFGQVLLVLLQTARKFDMNVQPQLVLLQKTLLNIEGLGRYLYPKLDLWQTAKPFMVHWLEERNSPSYIWEETKKKAPRWLEEVPKLPELVINSLKSLKTTNAEIKELKEELQEMRQAQKQRESKRIRYSVLFLIFIVYGLFAFVDDFSFFVENLPNWVNHSFLGVLAIWLLMGFRK